MKGHLSRCKLFKKHEESGSQKVLASEGSGVMTAVKYDKGLFRRSVNEMIVLNELPFAFVESEGFRRFCSNNLPMYTVHCRKTSTSDIYGMFLSEKAALKELFGQKKQRVSMTTDIWVAPTTSCSYMVVTAHWIDRDWKLQKRIISFKPVIDHKGDTISSHLIGCLEEWGIEKVFTVTVDNAKANDKALGAFTNALIMKGPDALVRCGDYLHMRCCAHILNLIVKDGLAKANQSIMAIRNAIKYVRSSGDRFKSFLLRVETGNVSRGSLCLDVSTRWNSTYLMLTAAIKFRVAFEKLLVEDKLYNEYFMEKEDSGEDGAEAEKRVGPPTFANWDEVQRFVKFLKIFFNCTLAFSATKSVTSSIAYNEIVVIERNLISLSCHSDSLLKTEAMVMRSKFEKYWDGLINMNPLVIIASVFDPRNKMQFATICFDKLYGKDSVEATHLRSSIKSVMKKLYEEYASKLSPTPSQGESSSAARSDNGESVDVSAMFDL
ncbi:PREDICTED: zinc finger BED domain-containing protein RICESLEEPER 2-like [Camelina sativa]|uniref:Zinc finger BED domain-containing protein RICESLEEPER 2-like n=1 Tax=Camelina sativa TaxID=90675 RepID=A0ABM0X5R3_CAMSA|nr:PREDICTED: zinc finger BED domain-containing protein RICESLEEPER 2-like [Camelina sativa]